MTASDQAKKRIADYLARRSTSRSDDQDHIHGYDVSLANPNGIALNASDLRALLAENATLNGEIQALFDEADMAEQEAGAIENDLIEAEKEIAAEDAEIARLREALQDAGAMRDAACRVSEWFCTEARHLEGPRINALRMALVAYDRHMQPDAGDHHE